MVRRLDDRLAVPGLGGGGEHLRRRVVSSCSDSSGPSTASSTWRKVASVTVPASTGSWPGHALHGHLRHEPRHQGLELPHQASPDLVQDDAQVGLRELLPLLLALHEVKHIPGDHWSTMVSTSDGRDQNFEVETETETFIMGLMKSRPRPRLLFWVSLDRDRVFHVWSHGIETETETFILGLVKSRQRPRLYYEVS